MPTQAEIAHDWGTTRQYVSTQVAKGCPTDSFENARLWRKAHASKRSPTNPKQLAKIVSEEKDDDSPEARERRKEYHDSRGTREPKLPSENPIQDHLDNARNAADEAWRLLHEAMIEEKDNKIGVRLAVHTKALEAVFRAEELYRIEMERRRILIPLNEAKDMARKGYDVIISRLIAHPQNVAARVNPHDPHHAMDILQTEVTGIIADAQKAFAV